MPKGNLGALAYGRMFSFLLVGLLNMRGTFLTIFSELDDALEKKTGSTTIFFRCPFLWPFPQASS
ncbi:hypothetical protein DSCA_55590 [Desulfosarcina alkanivorans]|uniref:Uncharacterized protein n=1 Tax=Desulfosarcina alkanivorans TaxID=571177 RepID=A0A5K7YUD3_9BACT|nr:hypothetical protein DSCA_55590 [Desulfosarcina alkanivorans]